MRADDPLPSWNDTGPKKAVVAFVDRVTTPGSSEFVPVPDRIATFDNDGTLWAEYQFKPATNGRGRASQGDVLYRTTPGLVRGPSSRAATR